MSVEEHRCTVGVGMENLTTGRQAGVSKPEKTKETSFQGRLILQRRRAWHREVEFIQSFVVDTFYSKMLR